MVGRPSTATTTGARPSDAAVDRAPAIAAIARAAAPPTGAFSPVPKRASTITPAQPRSAVACAGKGASSAIVSTFPPPATHRSRLLRASPATRTGSPTSQTLTGHPCSATSRATTKPSPPLLPRPATTTTPRAAASPRGPRISHAMPRPARSMSSSPGVPSSIVRRSSSRICTVVTTSQPRTKPGDADSVTSSGLRTHRLVDRTPHLADRLGDADEHRSGDDRVADVEFVHPV